MKWLEEIVLQKNQLVLKGAEYYFSAWMVGRDRKSGFCLKATLPQNKKFATDADIINFTADDKDLDNRLIQREQMSWQYSYMPCLSELKPNGVLKPIPVPDKVITYVITGKPQFMVINSYIKAVWLSNDVLIYHRYPFIRLSPNQFRIPLAAYNVF